MILQKGRPKCRGAIALGAADNDELKKIIKQTGTICRQRAAEASPR